MKKKCFELVIKDSLTSAYVEHIPAKNKADALKWAVGNGEVVSCKETEWSLSREYLLETLHRAGYGETEIALIDRIMQDYAYYD